MLTENYDIEIRVLSSVAASATHLLQMLQHKLLEHLLEQMSWQSNIFIERDQVCFHMISLILLNITYVYQQLEHNQAQMALPPENQEIVGCLLTALQLVRQMHLLRSTDSGYTRA